MKKIEMAIADFFDLKGDIYVNPNGVEICWLRGDAVCVSAFWPEDQVDENVSLVVINTCENYAEFMECFCIEDDVESSIDRISLEMLMNLHLAGKGAISCSIEGVNAPSLEFHNRAGGMIAKDEFENLHDVDVCLKTADDFIGYTRRYFELNKYLDGHATSKKGWPWRFTALESN